MESTSQNINLSIIDDNEDFLKIAESYLKRNNSSYLIKTYSSPIDFLKDFETLISFPDVIISDYKMPVINGLQLIERVRALSKNFQPYSFILMTGELKSDILSEGFKIGVDCYLEKVSNLESLFLNLNYSILKTIEKKKLDIRINELTSFNNALMEFSEESIIIQVDTLIQFVNTSFLKLIGALNELDVKEKSIISFIHKDYRKQILQEMQSNHINENDVKSNSKINRLNGTSIEIETRCNVISFNGKKAQLIFMKKKET